MKNKYHLILLVLAVFNAGFLFAESSTDSLSVPVSTESYTPTLSTTSLLSPPELEPLLPMDAVAIGFDNAVSALLIEPKGYIIVAGNFTSYYGVPVAQGIARLDKNGILDKEFAANTVPVFTESDFVALALQDDGKILVGGMDRSPVGKGQDGRCLIRLNRNGRVDSSFSTKVGLGVNSKVSAIAVQPDGKIIVGGTFNSFSGAKGQGLARLFPNGSLDEAFSIALGNGSGSKGGGVESIALQPDGKILLVGDFHQFNGVKVEGVVRLNPDGSTDLDFCRQLGINFFIGFTVLEPGDQKGDTDLVMTKVLVQPDKKILLGGEFVAFDKNQKIYKSRVGRLEENGSADLEFFIKASATAFETDVNTLLLNADGKILVGSNKPFSRLAPDGTHEEAFIQSAGYGFKGAVNALGIQPDGKLIVGGYFNSYKEIIVGNLVRLNPDGTVDEQFLRRSHE